MKVKDLLEGEVVAFKRKNEMMQDDLFDPEGRDLVIALDSKTDSEPKFLTRGKFQRNFGPFIIYEFEDKFYAIESGINGWKEADEETVYPLIYVYTPDKGNISMGNAKLYNRAEIRSGSKAFHKDNPEKMAIPGDLNKALAAIRSHYDKYRSKLKDPFAKAEAEWKKRREEQKKKMKLITNK